MITKPAVQAKRRRKFALFIIVHHSMHGIVFLAVWWHQQKQPSDIMKKSTQAK